MLTSQSIRPAVAAMACAFALRFSLTSLADDVASFATGGYARGLRSEELMQKIDTNGDGMISKDEWIAFQEKTFAMLDKAKTGKVDAKQFISADGGDMAAFATGGYARSLRTEAMVHKIDTDGDGTVSHDEFIAYQVKVFDMMDTSVAQRHDRPSGNVRDGRRQSPVRNAAARPKCGSNGGRALPRDEGSFDDIVSGYPRAQKS